MLVRPGASWRRLGRILTRLGGVLAEREAAVRQRQATVQQKEKHQCEKERHQCKNKRRRCKKKGISATTPRISAKRIGHQCEKDNKHLREKERHQAVIHGRALARLAGVLGAKKTRKKKTQTSQKLQIVCGEVEATA